LAFEQFHKAEKKALLNEYVECLNEQKAQYESELGRFMSQVVGVEYYSNNYGTTQKMALDCRNSFGLVLDFHPQ
jgi:hypothetical protein